MSKTFIEIERVHAGQERPYGPSVHEYRITLSESGPFLREGETSAPLGALPDWVLRLVELTGRIEFRHEWDRKGPIEWHDLQLREITNEGGGVWRVRIEQPYLD